MSSQLLDLTAWIKNNHPIRPQSVMSSATETSSSGIEQANRHEQTEFSPIEDEDGLLEFENAVCSDEVHRAKMCEYFVKALSGTCKSLPNELANDKKVRSISL